MSASQRHPLRSTEPSHIVAIGASAGGLTPIEDFFATVPERSGAAFVVVQHMSPDFKSLMKEILGKTTILPIHRAEDGMKCEADQIYLIPPRMNMSIHRGRLKLEPQDLEPGHAPNFAIDHFFLSLAEDIKERAVGVILSGTGTDGCRGVRAVSQAGGLVIAQDPDSSQFDGMPRSAIATGLISYSGAPEELARIVVQHVARQTAVPETDSDQIATEIATGGALATVSSILSEDSNTDFSSYRPSTMSRRISRRIAARGYRDIEEYIDLLQQSSEERDRLRSELLIGVTAFFRDIEAWDCLASEVLLKLIREKTPGDRIRVWVTACSTGEEVYTMAMLLLEKMEELGRSFEIKIFGTDVDKHALEAAAAGVYGRTIEESVDEARLERFFTAHAKGYKIRKSIREMIIFAEHNLTRDAPFTTLDIVTCRNALIYMEPELQERVLKLLHFSLRKGGYLFLGPAETTGALETEFDPVERKWRIFSKRRDASLPIDSRRPTIGIMKPVFSRQDRVTHAGSSREDSIGMEAFRLFLHDSNAACLIVNPRSQILQVLGNGSRYLKIPEGEVTADLAKMLHPDLLVSVTTALHRTSKAEISAEYHDVACKFEQGAMSVDIRVVHHAADRFAQEFFLVLLSESVAQRARKESAETESSLDSHAMDQISDLQHELQHTRESLQATIEELETTNEEQQSTNQELLASNEELQSTNEELQSVNEELHTVNAEFQKKNNELNELSNDIDNLLRSMDIGALFLDRDLSIRKATSSVDRIVNVSMNDVGRPIMHFSHNMKCPEFVDLLRETLENSTQVSREIDMVDGSRVFLRIMPYLRVDGEVDGVVVAFVDADEMYSKESGQPIRWVEAREGES